jgi:translation elongation factor EF-Ts
MDNEKQRQVALIQKLAAYTTISGATARGYLHRAKWDYDKALEALRKDTISAMDKLLRRM